MLEVHLGLADHIVRFEEVSVVHLNRELVVLARHLDVIHETVLEVRLAVLVSVVSVCLLHVLL